MTETCVSYPNTCPYNRGSLVHPKVEDLLRSATTLAATAEMNPREIYPENCKGSYRRPNVDQNQSLALQAIVCKERRRNMALLKANSNKQYELSLKDSCPGRATKLRTVSSITG
jgi:hypothetical protein